MQLLVVLVVVDLVEPFSGTHSFYSSSPLFFDFLQLSGFFSFLLARSSGTLYGDMSLKFRAALFITRKEGVPVRSTGEERANFCGLPGRASKANKDLIG